MNARQWIDAARESGLSVYPATNRPEDLFYISQPVLVPGISTPEPYAPERWPGLFAKLHAIDKSDLVAELHREASAIAL